MLLMSHSATAKDEFISESIPIRVYSQINVYIKSVLTVPSVEKGIDSDEEESYFAPIQ